MPILRINQLHEIYLQCGLKGNTAKGTSNSPYDLSTHDYLGNSRGETTANCYIVSAPGYYKIPLVYGNARKNGADNSGAYISNATGDSILKVFVNHLDRPITNPYIYNNKDASGKNLAPSNACIVWQDTINLLQDVKLTSDKHYIQFYVAQSTINQGNSVIAVRDASNTIMWSWHIWVTDESTETLLSTKGAKGTIYKFFPLNVGWISIDNDLMYYPARSVGIELTQTSTGKKANFIVYQSFGTASISSKGTNGYNPFFEGGRKDPSIPGMGKYAGNHKIYNNSYDYTTLSYDIATTNVTIGWTIQHPYIYTLSASSGSHWYEGNYKNLWEVNNTVNGICSNVTTKSIYDPCPLDLKFLRAMHMLIWLSRRLRIIKN